MSNYVLDLISRSIAGGRVLPEHEELSEGAKPGKDSLAQTTPPHAPPVSQKESIALSGVFRSYANSRGSFTPALQNIDLEIEQGEFVCIVGPSGCGKSTLLHLLAGLDRPTSGQVIVDGSPVQGPGTDIILLFQELGLFPGLTVRQNVEFGLKMAGVSRDERKERARVFLRMVHLSHFEDHYIHQLSGGMKQRVALARSLALPPKMLFRPGRIKSQFQVTLPRPRHVEDADVAYLSKEILGQLREEIDRSFNAEYSREEKR